MELLASGSQTISQKYYNLTRYGMTSIVDPLLRLESRQAIAIPSLPPTTEAIAFVPNKPSAIAPLNFTFTENLPDLVYFQIGSSTIALSYSDYSHALTSFDPSSPNGLLEFNQLDPSHLPEIH